MFAVHAALFQTSTTDFDLQEKHKSYFFFPLKIIHA